MRNKVAKRLRREVNRCTLPANRYEDQKHPPKNLVLGYGAELDMQGNLVPIAFDVTPITTRLVEGPRLVYRRLKRLYMKGFVKMDRGEVRLLVPATDVANV
jgi:hypothetical protein